jgi:hypothetical protein
LLTGLFDREALLRDLLRQRFNRRLRRRDVCARLVQRGLVVPRVDASDDLAGCPTRRLSAIVPRPW